MNRLIYMLLFLLTIASSRLYGQNISINSDGSSPDPSAMLDVKSTSSGVLVPRMTMAERNAIVNPATGLLIFQSDNTAGFYFNSGTPGSPAWTIIRSGEQADTLLSDSDKDTKIQVEESTDEDIIRIDMGGIEYFRLDSGRIGVYNTGASVYMGENAGVNDDLSAIRGNAAFGINALRDNQTGASNSAFGYNALRDNTSNSSTSVGAWSLNSNTGQRNVALGASAGFGNLTGANNVFLGWQSGASNTGSGNVFLGSEAGRNEIGSNLLYIENSNSATPLIFGDFANDSLKINGHLSSTTGLTVTNGNIGIGTNNPFKRLHVQSGGSSLLSAAFGDGAIFSSNSASGARFFFENLSGPADEKTMAIVNETVAGQGTTYFGSLTDNGGAWVNYLMALNHSTGNMGVGTIVPSAKLHLSFSGGYNGLLVTSATSGSSFTDGLTVGISQTAGNQAYVWNYENSNLLFGTNGSERMRIENGGDIGIGLTNPNVALDVSGSIEYTGTITDVSDERLKTDFKKIDSALIKVLSIEGLSYRMKDDSIPKREYGVIAQKVKEVFPELVSVVDPEKGYYGVSYVQFIPLLIEAIKEQQKQIENQKAINEELEEQIKLLTKQFNRIELNLKDHEKN